MEEAGIDESEEPEYALVRCHCGTEFVMESQLWTHMKLKSHRVCLEQENKVRSLLGRMTIEAPKCRNCDFTFVNESDLRNHLLHPKFKACLDAEVKHRRTNGLPELKLTSLYCQESICEKDTVGDRYVSKTVVAKPGFRYTTCVLRHMVKHYKWCRPDVQRPKKRLQMQARPDKVQAERVEDGVVL